MTTIRTTELQKIWVSNSDLITNVQFKTTFTDSDFPGVESLHVGVSDISSALLPGDAPMSAILSAIDALVGPQLDGVQSFHENELRFKYGLLTSTETSFEPPKDPLAEPLDRLDFWLAAAEVSVSKWSVRDTIAALPEDTPETFKHKAEVIAWFEEAERYRREDPILIAMAAAQGINEEQLDALWVWAVPEQT